MASDIILIAHSYGGLFAQLFAAMWPEAVSGIVFLDPNTPGVYVALSET